MATEDLREAVTKYVATSGWSAVSNLVDLLTDQQLEEEYYFLNEDEEE